MYGLRQEQDGHGLCTACTELGHVVTHVHITKLSRASHPVAVVRPSTSVANFGFVTTHDPNRHFGSMQYNARSPQHSSKRSEDLPEARITGDRAVVSSPTNAPRRRGRAPSPCDGGSSATPRQCALRGLPPVGGRGGHSRSFSGWISSLLVRTAAFLWQQQRRTQL